VLQDLVRALASVDPQERYETWVVRYDTVGEADLAAMKREFVASASAATLSVIVPIAGASQEMVGSVTRSLLAQVYERWEVDFVEASVAGGGARAAALLTSSQDPRFRSIADSRREPSDDWNDVLRSRPSGFAVIVNPRYVLREHALFLLARAIAHHPDVVVIYADEDMVDARGTRSGHYFKPDWNQALLRSQNYLGGLICIRRSVAVAAGGCDDELDGDFPWGLLLRVTAATPPENIRHLPFVLSHRTMIEPAEAPDNDAGRERVVCAHERRLAKLGERANVEQVGEASYQIKYPLPDDPPIVTVVMPTTANLRILRPCLDGLVNRTSYPSLNVLVVVNGARDARSEQYLDAIGNHPNIRVLVHDDHPFNFSEINNWAARRARGELLCLLNDDTRVMRSDWLSVMVARVVQSGVAAVGPCLLYRNGRIQHAGVVLGAGGVGTHSYNGKRRGIHGYHDRAVVDQDVSCVTAACMLIRQKVFEDVGGFDTRLQNAYNDVDLCLRVREAGWRIV
jgi:O-antigen biosynthesis protein